MAIDNRFERRRARIGRPIRLLETVLSSILERHRPKPLVARLPRRPHHRSKEFPGSTAVLIDSIGVARTWRDSREANMPAACEYQILIRVDVPGRIHTVRCSG